MFSNPSLAVHTTALYQSVRVCDKITSSFHVPIHRLTFRRVTTIDLSGKMSRKVVKRRNDQQIDSYRYLSVYKYPEEYVRVVSLIHESRQQQQPKFPQSTTAHCPHHRAVRYQPITSYYIDILSRETAGRKLLYPIIYTITHSLSLSLYKNTYDSTECSYAELE